MHYEILATNTLRIARRTISLLVTGLLLASNCIGNETPPQRPASLPETSSLAPVPEVRSVRDSTLSTLVPAPHRDLWPDTLSFITQPSFAADYAILRQDTLLVVASSLNVLYPFGQVAHAADIRSKYPQFSITQATEQANGLPYTYTILRHSDSSIKFYDSELDGATVVVGRIADPDVVLQNTIHIGMSLTEVIHTFFANIDQTKLQQIQTLRIDSGAAEIKYFYNFKDSKLKNINLDSYSILSKDI